MNCVAKRMVVFFIALVCAFNVNANIRTQVPCLDNIAHALINLPDSHIAREWTLLRRLGIHTNIKPHILITSYYPLTPTRGLLGAVDLAFRHNRQYVFSSYSVQDLVEVLGAGLLDQLIYAGCMAVVEYHDENKAWYIISYDRYQDLDLSDTSGHDIVYDDYHRTIILTVLSLDLNPNIKKFTMIGWRPLHKNPTLNQIWGGYDYKRNSE